MSAERNSPKSINGNRPEDLDFDITNEDFPQLQSGVVSKRGRNSPGATIPSPNTTNSKKKNLNPSPNSLPKASAQPVSKEQSTLVANHPFVTPATTSAASSGTNNANSTAISTLSNASSSVTCPTSSQATRGTTVQSPPLSATPGSPVNASQTTALPPQKQVAFAQTATQFVYRPGSPINSQVPNGNVSQPSKNPQVLNSNPPSSQNSSPTLSPISNPQLPGLPIASSASSMQSHMVQTPFVLHSAANQNINGGQNSQLQGSSVQATVLGQGTSQQGVPSIQHVPLQHPVPLQLFPVLSFPQMQQNMVQPLQLQNPNQYNDPTLQLMFQQAFMMGQQAGSSMVQAVQQGAHQEVTFNKDKLIPPAQKIKASLQSVDINTTAKQVRQIGLCFI